MKNYTQDWNGEFIKNTQNLKDFNLCIEIGSFEGLTSNYIVDNLLSTDGKLICIDPLTDNYLNDNLSEIDIIKNNGEFSYFNNQYDRFINNVDEHINTGKIELVRELSSKSFKSLIEKYKGKVDFIYIDGDHRPEGVYIDSINSFELCKIEGFILFDDYLWEDTKDGIDKFLLEFQDKIEIIIKDYQVLIKKIKK